MKSKNKNLRPVRGKYNTFKPLVEIPENRNKWLKAVSDKESVIVLDLFSGSGGLSLGFENSGFFTAAAIDSDRYACETFRANFNTKVFCLDINKIKDPKKFLKQEGIKRVDVIIGGPPCQGFSTEGRGKIRNLNKTKHYHNSRNLLYKNFIRFVKELKPMYFVMENVPGMETYYRNGISFAEKIENEFREINYRVERKILDASNFSVPQFRKRLFFIGCKKGLDLKWAREVTKNNPVTLKEAIGDLPVRKPPCFREVQQYRNKNLNSYQKIVRRGMLNGKSDVVFDHIIRDVRKDDKSIFKIMPEGGMYTDVPESLRRYRSDIFKDKYRKLEWSKPSPTIAAHIAKDGYRYIHPDKKQTRTLSIREVARIQSYPDNYRFAGYRTNIFIQIGNSVPPLLAQKIAIEIMKEIQKVRKKPLKINKTLF